MLIDSFEIGIEGGIGERIAGKGFGGKWQFKMATQGAFWALFSL
jgi:hypothetical protein